jgi:hypothetical protein
VFTYLLESAIRLLDEPLQDDCQHLWGIV